MKDTQRVDPRHFRKLFEQLAWVHWTHAILLLQMLGTGVFLYFPGLRTQFVEYHMAIRNWHLAVSLLYAILLVVSLPLIIAYFKMLSNRFGKRLHLKLVYFAALIWVCSGVIMWRIHNFPVSWREPATLLHDWMSLIAVPWIAIHITWAVIRRLYGKQLNRTLRTAQTLQKHYLSAPTLTRREFLVGMGAVLGSLVAGTLTRWYWPILEPLKQQGGNRQTGSFRLYNVAPEIPKFDPNSYRLQIDGLVNEKMSFSLADLQSFPQTSITRDFHCVTGWSVTNVAWSGIPLSLLLQKVRLLAEAKYMTVYSFDGLYSDSYTLQQLSDVDVILALRMNGSELPVVHGAPCRIIFPSLYGYKSVKWVNRIEFTRERQTGYWEQRGYDLDGILPS